MEMEYGLKEASFYYLGGDAWKAETKTITTMLKHAGLDGLLGFANNPVDAFFDAVTSDKEFMEVWNANGGVKGSLMEGGSAFFVSLIGEYSKYKKTKNANTVFEITDENWDIDDIDISEGAAVKIKDNEDFYRQRYADFDKSDLYWYTKPDGTIVKPYSSEYYLCKTNNIELKKMANQNYQIIKDDLIKNYGFTPKDASKYIENMTLNQNIIYQQFKISHTANPGSIDQLLDSMEIGNGKYGIDQGTLGDLIFYQDAKGNFINQGSYKHLRGNKQKLKKLAEEQYFELKSELVTKYRMTELDASNLISAIDSYGACSYADFANTIVANFKDTPDLFQEKFGFPLYIQNANTTDIDGNRILNPKSVKRDKNGYTSFKDTKQQQYLMYGNGLNEDLMNGYLQSKIPDLRFDCDVIIDLNTVKNTTFTEQTRAALKSDITQRVMNGEEISLYVSYNKDVPIRFVEQSGNVMTTTHAWGEGGAHAVKITGITDDYYVCSSWGRKIYIPIADLEAAKGFAFFSSKIIPDTGF